MKRAYRLAALAVRQRFERNSLLSGMDVRVRIGGAVCTIHALPRDFEGWGVFSPTSMTEARLQREATLTERSRYLGLLPPVNLIVARRRGPNWLGAAANFADQRFRLPGMVPINLASNVALFDVVHARFDYRQFWFEQKDLREDPQLAIRLCGQLDNGTHPRALQFA